MRTYILYRKNELGEIADITGPCDDDEVGFLLKDETDGIFVVDEQYFKTQHPVLYRKALLTVNFIETIATWIRMLYNNSKPLYIEENLILCDDFVIDVSTRKITLAFAYNCNPSESASLVLYLKSCIFDDISLEISDLVDFTGKICEN